MYMIL